MLALSLSDKFYCFGIFVFVLVFNFFVFVFNRFLFSRFSFVLVFIIFFVLVLVFVNEFVIFSFFTIFVFVFVNENHTAVASGNKSVVYQLVRDVSMIITCHAITDGRLHQPRQRRQNIDWRINLPASVTVMLKHHRQHFNPFS